ncbi:MAG: sulfide/dihydroorotate dehydrogenase-like FAD/NAD-binding protein [Candidatus Zixiibacteriota bacterium]
MVKILEHQRLNETNFRIVFDSPLVAKKIEPGQFMVLRIREEGERIPMSLADMDPENGTVTVIYQVIGQSTTLLSTKKAGEEICDLVGPMGVASHYPEKGNFMVIGGGIGIAPIHPVAREAKERGLHVIGIIGARTKDLLFYEEEMQKVTDELYVTTDDGSYGKKGFVTDALKELYQRGKKIDHILAIGPVPMMKFVCSTTRPMGIPTWVSLNPIMIDATGMCGVCRVSVGGKTKFACVDGPDFDGHQVDFDLLTKRLSMYESYEKQSLEKFKKEYTKETALKKA